MGRWDICIFWYCLLSWINFLNLLKINVFFFNGISFSRFVVFLFDVTDSICFHDIPRSENPKTRWPVSWRPCVFLHRRALETSLVGAGDTWNWKPGGKKRLQDWQGWKHRHFVNCQCVWPGRKEGKKRKTGCLCDVEGDWLQIAMFFNEGSLG